MNDGRCIFCRVVAGKERAWIVYRDAKVIGLLDRFPMTKGHTLIIPAQHYESMFDIPQYLLEMIADLAKRLAISYERSLGIQGVSIEILNHKEKDPAHRHFHLHVIPRYDRDDPRDPAKVAPSQAFPEESVTNLNNILSLVRAGLASGQQKSLRRSLPARETGDAVL